MNVYNTDFIRTKSFILVEILGTEVLAHLRVLAKVEVGFLLNAQILISSI